MMNLLEELIKIDSSQLSGANEAIELAAQYLEQKGISGEIVESEGFKSYVSVIGSGDRTLVLNGHLDVVSGKKNQFTPRVEAGRIIGRGSADMKGGCVAMINTFLRLKEKKLKSRIMLQLVPDEETGGKNGTRFLVDQGYTGDFVICTEPTNLQVSIQSKGIMRMDIHTWGKSAHGSRPWEGENAILKGMENFSRIQTLPILNSGSPFYEKSSVNLATIKSGDIYNRVPDHSIMGLDIRFIPDLDPEEIIRDIRNVVEGDVEVSLVEKGVDVSPGHPVLKELCRSVEKILPGEKVKLAAQHGGSDTRYFNALGIPAVEFGPCGDFWHGDDEYAVLESISQLEDILVDFAVRF